MGSSGPGIVGPRAFKKVNFSLIDILFLCCVGGGTGDRAAAGKTGIKRHRSCLLVFSTFNGFYSNGVPKFAPVPVSSIHPLSASPPDFTGNVLRALLKAKAGTTVTLECRPQAYPAASILWKRGNLPIHINDR